MPLVRPFRVGTPIVWDGVPATVSAINLGGVSLTDASGREFGPFEYADVIAAAQLAESAPVEMPRAYDMHLWMSETAKQKLKRDLAVLHRLDTGLKPSDPPEKKPPRDLDPRYTTQTERKRALARRLARKSGNQYRSEFVQIGRLIRRRQTNPAGLIDPRTLKPRTTRFPAAADELEAFLLARVSLSNTSKVSRLRQFRAHMRATKSFVPLPENGTLLARIRDLETMYPQLRKNGAATRISAHNRPRQSAKRRGADRPGELVLFDTTTANVILYDPVTGKEFRLELTLAIDLASRCLVGMSLAKTTVAMSVSLCLADILRPKQSAEAGEWTDPEEDIPRQPYVGIPESYARYRAFTSPGDFGPERGFRPEGIVVDNGRPFVSAYMTAQAAQLGCSYEPQRSYTPTDKGQIERIFNTIKVVLEETMPGFIGGSIHDRGDIQSDDVVLTPDRYERRLRRFIDMYNHRVHKSLVLADDPYASFTPYQMWALLVQESGAVNVPDYTLHPVMFLPNSPHVIGTDGVILHRLRYRSSFLKELKESGPAPGQGGKWFFYYDPTDMRRIWVIDNDGVVHEIPWDRAEGAPKFGMYFISEVAAQFGTRKSIATATFERAMVDMIYENHVEDVLAAKEKKALQKRGRPKGTSVQSLQERIIGPQVDRLLGDRVDIIVHDSNQDSLPAFELEAPPQRKELESAPSIRQQGSRRLAELASPTDEAPTPMQPMSLDDLLDL